MWVLLSDDSAKVKDRDRSIQVTWTVSAAGCTRMRDRQVRQTDREQKDSDRDRNSGGGGRRGGGLFICKLPTLFVYILVSPCGLHTTETDKQRVAAGP